MDTKTSVWNGRRTDNESGQRKGELKDSNSEDGFFEADDRNVTTLTEGR